MEFGDGFRRDFARLFAWRRDLRRFRTDPVPEVLVAELASFRAAKAQALACQSPGPERVPMSMAGSAAPARTAVS